jgi:2Fe-2S ferredoxin
MVFLPDTKRVEIQQNETILEVALRNEIPLEHSCGGMGSCGTCRIFVTAGLDRFEPRNEIENEIAVDRSFSVDERLACQNLALDGLEVKVPQRKKD